MNATLDAVPILKGIHQAKILRTMLRLPSFTRKELAEEAGVEIGLVNAVVARQRQLLSTVEQRHSGGRGAPEEVLALRTDARKTLVSELQPLYEELQTDWDRSHELSSYVPASLEFRVVQEMIDRFDLGDSWTSPRRQLTAPDVSRAFELLGTVSRRERIPIEPKPGAKPIVNQELDPKQQVAKAGTDALKAKLCWLAAGSTDKAMGEFFADVPIAAGASYLSAAVQCFREHKIESAAESLEFWSIRQVWPTVLSSFTSPWAGQTIKALTHSVDAKVLPRLSASIAAVLEPSPAQITEGLMCAYDHFYGSAAGKVLGFLDVRPEVATFAIMDNSVPRLQLCTPTIFEGDDVTLRSFEETAEQIEKGLAFYRQAIGKHIEELLLAGVGAKNAELRVLINKLLPGVRVHTMDLAALGSAEGKSLARYAAEIGLAVKATAVRELVR